MREIAVETDNGSQKGRPPRRYAMNDDEGCKIICSDKQRSQEPSRNHLGTVALGLPVNTQGSNCSSLHQAYSDDNYDFN